MSLYHSCELIPLLWAYTTLVSLYHSCDLIPLSWPYTTLVTLYHSCDLIPLLWPYTTLVTLYHSCDLIPLLWPYTTLVTLYHSLVNLKSHDWLDPVRYRITGNSRDRKHSRISRFVDHSRIFSSKSFHLIKRIELTATNIANGFEEDSTRECFLANGLNIEDSRMFSVARISRYTVLSVNCLVNLASWKWWNCASIPVHVATTFTMKYGLQIWGKFYYVTERKFHDVP